MQINEVSQYGNQYTMGMPPSFGDNGVNRMPPPPRPPDGGTPGKPPLDFLPEEQRQEVQKTLDSFTEEQRVLLKQKMDANRPKVGRLSPEQMATSFLEILNQVASTNPADSSATTTVNQYV